MIVPTPTPAPNLPLPSPSPSPVVVIMHDVIGGGATFADWLQGWGGVAAAVFSGVTLIYAARLFTREQRIRREDQALVEADREDQRAAQARLVIMKSCQLWGEVAKATGDEAAKAIDEGSGPAMIHRLKGIYIELVNYSDEPIFEVSFCGYHSLRGPIEYLPPGKPPIPVRMPQGDTMTPLNALQQEEYIVLVASTEHSSNWKDLLDFSKVHFVISFADARGNRWTRIDNGQPQRDRSQPGELPTPLAKILDEDPQKRA